MDDAHATRSVKVLTLLQNKNRRRLEIDFEAAIFESRNSLTGSEKPLNYEANQPCRVWPQKLCLWKQVE
jgi:hypothetical protein